LKLLVVYTGGSPFQARFTFTEDVTLVSGKGSDNGYAIVSTDPGFDLSSANPFSGADAFSWNDQVIAVLDSTLQIFSYPVPKGQTIYFSAEGGFPLFIYYNSAE